MRPTTRPPRLNARQLLADLLEELVSLDRGLLWTLAQLWTRPGRTMRLYIEWRDPRLTRPSRLLLLTLAVAALALQWQSVGSEFARGVLDGISAPEAESGSLASNFLLAATQQLLVHVDLWLVISWLPAAGAAMGRACPQFAFNSAEKLVLGAYSLCLFIPLQVAGLFLLHLQLLSASVLVQVWLLAPFMLMTWSAYDYAAGERMRVRSALACGIWMPFLLAVTLCGVWSLLALTAHSWS